MVAIEQYRKYRAIVCIRRGKLPVKLEAERLDGKTIVVTYGWRIEHDEDRSGFYRDEIAMLLDAKDDPGARVLWVASGDLEILEALP